MMENNFDLEQFLPYLLNRAADAASKRFQVHYKDRYGMLRTEWRVLFHLGRYQEMTAKDIGARADIHKTKISRAVAALEKRRFLTRTAVPEDRRHEALRLTPAGKAAFEDLCDKARQFDETMAVEFSAGDVVLLRRCLSQIAGF